MRKRGRGAAPQHAGVLVRGDRFVPGASQLMICGAGLRRYSCQHRPRPRPRRLRVSGQTQRRRGKGGRETRRLGGQEGPSLCPLELGLQCGVLVLLRQRRPHRRLGVRGGRPHVRLLLRVLLLPQVQVQPRGEREARDRGRGEGPVHGLRMRLRLRLVLGLRAGARMWEGASRVRGVECAQLRVRGARSLRRRGRGRKGGRRKGRRGYRARERSVGADAGGWKQKGFIAGARRVSIGRKRLTRTGTGGSGGVRQQRLLRSRGELVARGLGLGIVALVRRNVGGFVRAAQG